MSTAIKTKKGREMLRKWNSVITGNETFGGAKITSSLKQQALATLCENAAREGELAPKTREAAELSRRLLTEAAPANQAGPAGALGQNAVDGTAIAGYDPILISMLRRTVPNLIAFDIAGVQPLTGPDGAIFALRAKYTNQAGNEALFNEADTGFSGTGTHAGTDPTQVGYTTGSGMSTAAAEALGTTGSPQFAEMAFTVEKVLATAKVRGLRAELTNELISDFKAIHGLDALMEISNILATELTTEINRELLRTLYTIAKPGAQKGVATNGIVDVAADTDGRWLGERYKGLIFRIHQDCNAIAKETRRGKGNFIVTTSDVAAAMALGGKMAYAPTLEVNDIADDTGNTFVGMLQGGVKVYVDPYFQSTTNDFYVAGYKGPNQYDAGLFYAPYIALQQFEGQDPRSYAKSVAFKSRYALVANPFAGTAGALTANSNAYYRRVQVTNL